MPETKRPSVLTHPSGETYTLVDDDVERMECEHACQDGHRFCGTWPCCGWPRTMFCPCEQPATGTQPASDSDDAREV